MSHYYSSDMAALDASAAMTVRATVPVPGAIATRSSVAECNAWAASLISDAQARDGAYTSSPRYRIQRYPVQYRGNWMTYTYRARLIVNENLSRCYGDSRRFFVAMK